MDDKRDALQDTVASIELETVDACVMCGSTMIRPWRRATDRDYQASGHAFSYARCQGCRARFLRVRPHERSAATLYDDRYKPYDVDVDRRDTPVEFLRQDVSRLPAPWLRLVRPCYESPRPSARLLDLGCGSPFFVLAAMQAGWTSIGTDFSSDVVHRVRAAGVEAYDIDGVWSALAADPVDLVRMNHVLEHLYDPLESLRRVASVIRPGGLLHVAVPNAGGITASVSRDHWFPLEPRHVVQYDPQLLRSVLEQAGFSVLGIGHQGSPSDVRRSAVYAARAWRAPARMTALLGDPRTERVWAPLTAGAAMLRHGDRIHAVARR